MAARFWANVRRFSGVALALLVLTPAAAGAQATWQQVGGGPAPGGDDLAVIAGVPHVAWAADDGVHVSKLTSAGGPWQAVGGAIHHASGAAVNSPSLTSDSSGTPWVTWTEDDASGTPQARVAKLVNGSWQEVAGGARPINRDTDPRRGPSGAYDPRIIIFQGRPYVAYVQDTPVELQLDVVRLSANGSAWERVTPPVVVTRPGPPRLAVSAGRLYLAVENVLGPDLAVIRLNGAATGWEKLGSPPEARYLGDIADVAGVPQVGYSAPLDADPGELRVSALASNDSWGRVGPDVATSPLRGDFNPQGLAADGGVPYTAALLGSSPSRQVMVSRYAGGSWEGLPSPSDPARDAISAQLAPGATGGVWLLYGESSGGSSAWYLDSLGASIPTAGGADGGGTPSGPPEPSTGLCANTIRGTALADTLFGTSRSDSISGLGGGDTIYGYAGSDCLYGGSGNDLIYGGRGNDFFRGGAGNDRLYGGSGNDDLNGGAGNDRIVGGPGGDVIDAGSGNDLIYIARDGADLVDCGPGRDTAVISLEDGYRNCERVILRH